MEDQCFVLLRLKIIRSSQMLDLFTAVSDLEAPTRLALSTMQT